jgi:hypothetical protein
VNFNDNVESVLPRKLDFSLKSGRIENGKITNVKLRDEGGRQNNYK